MAECHLRLKNKEEAVRYFKLAGDFQAAGMIYQDLKDYTNAIDCFLKSEMDEKDGYRQAKQAARKVRDIQSVYEQAKSLFDAGLYKKALALFSIFSNTSPEVGICLLRMNDEAGAQAAWSRITNPAEYARLIDICLSQDAVLEGGKFLLSKLRLSVSPRIYDLPFDLFEFKIIDFMDAYFDRVRDPEEMQIWGKFLAHIDFKGTFWKKTFFYLELGGDTKDLIDFVENLELFNRTAYLKIKRQWKRELPALEEREDWDGLALRDLFLNKGRRLPELLQKMTVSAKNFVFFLLGENPYFEAAVDWCTRNNQLPKAWEMCAKWKQYDRAALLCEKAGFPEKAAGFYVLARQHGKAASIYADLGKFNQAGDVFYKLGEFGEALKFYQMEKQPDKRRLARTYEKMGDFAAALNLWKEAGDKRAAEKCRARWEKSGQRSLFNR